MKRVFLICGIFCILVMSTWALFYAEPEPELPIATQELPKLQQYTARQLAQFGDAVLAWKADYADQLDGELAARALDAGSASEAQSMVVAAFAGLLGSSELGSITCGTTLCRLQINHSDPLGHEQLLAQVNTRAPWAAPSLVVQIDRGRPATLIYLACPGTRLPHPRSAVADFMGRQRSPAPARPTSMETVPGEGLCVRGVNTARCVLGRPRAD